MWNGVYQYLYDRAKKTVKNDACMKIYNASTTLYLGNDESGDSLGARLLQVRDGMNCRHNKVPDNVTLCPTAFTSKSLLSTKWQYRT